MDCRDWLSTLWSASFRGFAFHFDSDEEEGGRGLVIHKFPHRDDPYVEDLGEEPRLYSGRAYVHGDQADALAARFAEALAAAGPATLVLPIRGPVTVHCQSFRRTHERDKLGYAAFEVRFVRAGAASALVSVPYAAQLVYQAADRLAAALAALFPRAVARSGQPDHVVQATADGFASAAAALDVVRTGYAVAPAASARLRDQIAALLDSDTATGAATDAALASDAITLIAATRDLADALAADSAAAAMAATADAFVTVTATAYLAPRARTAAANAQAAARLARLAALTAWAEALVRRDYKSRPDGVSARAEAAARFQAELEQCFGAADAGLAIAIQDLRGSVVDYLTRLIADLKPVVTVETASQMPSLALAWRLYADPLRAEELVARNAVRHPSFLPQTLSALAPTA